MSIPGVMFLIVGPGLSGVVIKATLLLLALQLALRLMRRRSAATRHSLIVAVFAVLVAMPPVLLLSPGLEVPVSVAARASGAALAPEAVLQPSPASVAPATAARITARDMRRAALAVWLAGAGVMGFMTLVGLRRLHLLGRGAQPIVDPRLREACEALLPAGLPIELSMHETIESPITFGVVRQTILLPYRARAWSRPDLARALVHEIAHCERRDWIVQMVARAACVVFWFHPLVWIGWKQLAMEAERACDDAVLDRSDGAEYAEQLVRLARGMVSGSQEPALAMARTSDLATRVRAILNPHQPRGTPGATTRVLILAVGMLATLGMMPLRPISSSSAVTPVRLACVDTAAQRRLVGAAASGATERVERLLSSGLGSNCPVKGDGTPLIAAIRYGHADIAKLLLEGGADPNLASVGDGNPLIVAAAAGSLPLVQLLLDAGARVNDSVIGDENALIQAAAGGASDVVALLIARGADVNAAFWLAPRRGEPNGELRTALTIATARGHREVAGLLRRAGATR